MNEAEMSKYITDTLKGVDIVENADNLFFFYNPPHLPQDHMFPFATLMTNDVNDEFSNLNRPSIYRLNIGVSKQTFQSLFGVLKRSSQKDGEDQGDDYHSDYDFTALDKLMPHPVYGRQYWLCVLNPSNKTLEMKVHPLLVEAYDMAVRKREK